VGLGIVTSCSAVTEAILATSTAEPAVTSASSRVVDITSTKRMGLTGSSTASPPMSTSTSAAIILRAWSKLTLLCGFVAVGMVLGHT